jgi:TPP-dependent indolepyruvate ferredoxin oxidoreductase alpha subunit
MRLQIDPERCQLCATCPLQVGCLGQVVERPNPQQAPVIDEKRCYGCGLCSMICKYDAVVEKR